jgi:hypothetical protein
MHTLLFGLPISASAYTLSALSDSASSTFHSGVALSCSFFRFLSVGFYFDSNATLSAPYGAF